MTIQAESKVFYDNYRKLKFYRCAMLFTHYIFLKDKTELECEKRDKRLWLDPFFCLLVLFWCVCARCPPAHSRWQRGCDDIPKQA